MQCHRNHNEIFIFAKQMNIRTRLFIICCPSEANEKSEKSLIMKQFFISIRPKTFVRVNDCIWSLFFRLFVSFVQLAVSFFVVCLFTDIRCLQKWPPAFSVIIIFSLWSIKFKKRKKIPSTMLNFDFSFSSFCRGSLIIFFVSSNSRTSI